MDSIFWVGIVIGAVVSLFMSIIANLFSDRVRQVVAGTIEFRLNRKRETELRTYRLLRDIHRSRPEGIIRLVILSTKDLYSGFLSVAGMVSVVGLSVLIVSAKIDPALHKIILVIIAAAGTASVTLLLMGWIGNVRYRLLLLKLNRFDDYEKKIEEKWGKQT